MAEYIDRAALIEEINAQKKAAKTSWPKQSFVVGDALTCIYTAPAADVVEVKRGRWTFVEQRFYHGGFVNLFRCSECKAATDRQHNFCPNCGARMEESSCT